jgi:hypothetical protein
MTPAAHITAGVNMSEFAVVTLVAGFFDTNAKFATTAIIDSGISGVNNTTIAIAEWGRAQP